jgi:endonuclease/exonuclease/phosphatase family metal-dependent hydrolase
MVLRAALGVVVLGALGVVPAGAAARPLVVVQANVGNINGACAPQVFKLCQRPVERRAARALRARDPDVVGFEEILPERTCRDHPATAPTNLCSAPRSPRSQVRRLLGRGYAVSCASRLHYECLAVRRHAGLRTTRLRTRPLVDDCDPGFTLDRAALRVHGRPVALLVAHPDSMDVPCRARQLRDAFATLPRRGPVLALGDWNLDPYRERDASVRVFRRARRHLGLRLATGRRFSLLPGSSMGDPTGRELDHGASTIGPPFGRRTIDHVLVRGFAGRCHVRRVDGGGGMDHRAQVCRLRLRR